MGFSGGKFILTGEHAVMYKVPALSIPIKKIGVKSTLKRSDTPFRIILNNQTFFMKTVPEELVSLTILINRLCSNLKIDLNKLTLKIKSNLPYQKGLGFSASLSASVVKAFYKFKGLPLKDEDLIYHLDVTERINHSDHSGIDMLSIIKEKPLYFINRDKYELIEISLNGYLLVFDSNDKSNTKKSVLKVQSFFNKNENIKDDILKQFENVVNNIYQNIKDKDIDALGENLNQNHQLLKQIGVSNNKINKLINLTLKEGALGGKITGSGNGGCFIVLVNSKKVIKKTIKIMNENNAKLITTINLRNLR